MKVSLNFVEDILARASKEDGAGLRLLTVDEEGEVFIADLLDLEDTTLSSHVALLQFARPVEDGRSCHFGDAIVVCLPHPPQGRHSSLHEVVLSKIRDSLLGDDYVRLYCKNIVHGRLDPVFFGLQDGFPVAFLGDLDVGLTLSLLVFERAVKKDDARVTDLPLHLRMDDILVDHNAAQNSAILDVTPRNLLDLGVSLHIDLLPSIGVDHDRRDGIHGQVDHEAAEPVGVLGPHAR
mmetsp:Transcript_45265/g.142481  ORF Transcript_45265/g.142481 Transcript_45265/m.142481 type:complete len:236 (-) Transcript_45265:478-1185(-)